MPTHQVFVPFDRQGLTAQVAEDNGQSIAAGDQRRFATPLTPEPPVDPEGWRDLRLEMANGRKYTQRARKGYFGG